MARPHLPLPALAILFALLLLALALGTALGAAWERSYTLSYSGQTAWVARDNFGVPHIYATGEPALWYANGYTTAEDRLWQLDSYRHDAKGTLAAVFGSDYVGHDQQIALEGYSEAERQAQYDALPARIKTMLISYRDGINDRIAQVLAAPDTLGPKEFWDYGHIPEPWTVTDSIAIMHMMTRRFGAGGGSELNNQAYLDANGWDAFNAWFPLNDPTATVTIPDAEAPPPPAFSRLPALRPEGLPLNNFPGIPPEIWAQRRQEQQDFLDALLRLNLCTKLGSFSDVVAPGKSATGRPMLLGAPQMGYKEPQISNEADLHCPGLDVAGMQFAGVPCILIGRNRDVAWTTTSGCSDNIDTVVETLNPANRYQYWYNGAWRTMEQRTETIQVAGASPLSYTVYRTVHGPVWGWDLAGNRAFALHATFWNSELSSIEAFMDYNLAHNLSEFQSGVAKIVTSHNFLAADRTGNIGYWHAGRFPLRAAGVDPRLPMSGEGDQEWTGFWPFADLPQKLNPTQGYFANWNNKPVYWWDHGDEREWLGWDHVQLIMDLMNPDPSVTFAEMKAIPYNINSKGTYMQVLEVGSDPTLPAVNIVPPGQSGFISKTGVYDTHFFDQKDLYYSWDYKPFDFMVPERVACTLAFGTLDTVQGGEVGHPLAFTLRVEGRDPFGNLATGYAGTVALSVPEGWTISPTSVTCAAGVWQGAVTVSGPPTASLQVSAADSWWGAGGSSTSFRLAGKGDVNGDGSINVLDVMRTVNQSLGYTPSTPPRVEFQQWAAEVNNTPPVNVLDVLKVVNLSLGIASPQSAPARAPRPRTGASVSLGGGKGVWLLQVRNAPGLAGLQATLRCPEPSAVTLPDSLAGWQVQSRYDGTLLHLVAWSGDLTPAPNGELTVTIAAGGKAKPRLTEVVLGDAAGNPIAVR